MRFLITLLVSFSCFYVNFQPFRYLLGGGQVLAMLVPMALILVYDGLLTKKTTLAAIGYIATMFILRYLGVEYFESCLSESVSILFAVVATEHYLKTRDNRYAKWVLISFYGSFIFMSLISIPQFYLFPEMTRQLLFTEVEGYMVETKYYWSLSYASMQSIPVVLIPLLLIAKNSNIKKTRILSISAIVIILVCLTLGDATTPLLFSAIVVALILYFKKELSLIKNIRRLIPWGILGVLVFNKYTIIALLSFVQPIFEGTTNYGKIDDSISYLETGVVEESSNMGQRDLVYDQSKEVFFSHPFWVEKNDDRIGHHSYIIDHLAVMGLIFIIPFMIMMIVIYKKQKQELSIFRDYYIINFGVLVMMAYMKNYFIIRDACFIVPLALLYLEYLTNNKNNNVKIKYLF